MTTTSTRSGAARRGLAKYLAEPLTVGDPDIAGPLAVYPLFGTATKQQFVALSQADGEVTIGEVASASVRDLAVTNTGKVPVLLYEGQELLGGQQNRSVDSAVLIAAGTKLSLPVTCVESGRWDHSSHRAAFSSSPHSPSPQLRKAKSREMNSRAAAGHEARADQGEVWGLVDSISSRLRASSRTRALSDTYDQRRKEIRKIERGIRLHDGQLGALATIGGELCVLDFVGRPEVFAALHGPLVQGYALEVLGADADEAHTPSVEQARRWVGAALGAEGDQRPSLGLGADVRFIRNGVTGSALVHEGELVHLTGFPVDGSTTPGSRSNPGSIRRPSRRRTS